MCSAEISTAVDKNKDSRNKETNIELTLFPLFHCKS
jgi:hypothetical protein